MEFEELDYQHTPLGDISLRRRAEPRLGGEIVYEVKLGDEFLMSSLFTAAETQLAVLGMAGVRAAEADVVVGGLGLGYTAATVLQDPSVRSLTVIEFLEPVIKWHRRGLVPLGATLTSDKRCNLAPADFFAAAASPGDSFELASSTVRAHAILLDIDHSPRHWLNPDNSSFYTASKLANMARKLHPGGIFGMWSNDPPDADFIALLDSVFQSCESHTITFSNPYTGGESSSTVYTAKLMTSSC